MRDDKSYGEFCQLKYSTKNPIKLWREKCYKNI